jgi:Uma2 family endonuclease
VIAHGKFSSSGNAVAALGGSHARPAPQNLPHKIELNARGKIEMSPASNVHGRLEARLATKLGTQLSGGEAITECSILTEIGVRVPDVAWASAEFVRQHGTSTPFPVAPELCIEIVSPSSSDDEIQEKIAYLAARAREVWIVQENGGIDYHDRDGKKPNTSFNIEVSLPDLSK